MSSSKTSNGEIFLDQNLDPHEAEKFNQMAADWWNPDGPCRPLHDLNPTRLQYIKQFTSLADKKTIDIGCGGGILSEAMAKQGAQVTALDIAAESIAIAKQHQEESALTINYLEQTAEQHSIEHSRHYDIVVCMELLEHVPDPAALIGACATLLKPDGHLFLSTLNRTPQAYIGAIFSAEYLLNLLPKGTHQYAQFIRPSELCHWSRAAGLRIDDLHGMAYNPFTRMTQLNRRVDINYLAHGQFS